MICSPWADRNDLAACNCPQASPDVIDLALESASEILFSLTGRQYPGECQATLRPCSAPGGGFVPIGWTYPWFPTRIGEQWVNLGPCGCHMASDCSCTIYPRVNLGRDDIQSVDTVSIDGTVLDPGNYRLDSNRYLVRTDGGKWPCCQDLSLDSGVGTWSIALTYGWPVPASLTRAAAILAMEFVKACNGDGTCRLPLGTQSVVKQGISIELSDPQIFLEDGRTGIYEVDLAIRASNPHGITRSALVRSPEVRPAGVWG